MNGSKEQFIELREKSMYKINEEFFHMLNQAYEQDGELDEELEAALAINEAELKVKSLSYLEVITNKKARIVMAKERMKGVTDLIKREQRIVDTLETNLLNAIKIHGEFEADFVSFGTRKSTAVQVDADADLKDEFRTVKVTSAPNKSAIKKALQQGEEIEGCSLVENLNLKIK